MRIEFDQLADALHVHLAEGEVEKTEEINSLLNLSVFENVEIL